MILRVRTQLGTWRLNSVSGADTIASLRDRLETEHRTDLCGRPLTRDQAGKDSFPEYETVGSLGLQNGDMIFALVDEEKTGVHENTKMGRLITKEGNIVAQEYSKSSEQTGFRPGMMPLRSMKMQWTLNEFMALDEQFVYRPKRQEKAFCPKVSLDTPSLDDFQQYMWNFDYRKIRIGFLYGYFLENGEVQVECVYDPPQDTTDTSFAVLSDPNEPRVEEVARLLGLRKVGWIIAHPPREKGFFLSGDEVLFAAEQQLIAADGINETSFVTVKVTLDEESKVQVEGYQVSKQCMEMVAEGVLSVSPNLGCCLVNPTFTVIQEGKETKEVDNNFFLTLVPITQHQSVLLTSDFPKANREGSAQTREHMKKSLLKVGKNGWTFKSVLSDFQLLLFLCDYLDLSSDLPTICQALTNEDVPLNEGYQLLIRSLAGIEM